MMWFMESPGVRWIGKRSYGIYLYHLPIVFALDAHRNSTVPKAILVVFLSMLLAGLSFRFVEAPILKKKDAYRTKGTRPIPQPERAVA